VWDAYPPALQIPSIALARLVLMFILLYAGIQDYKARKINGLPVIIGLLLNILFAFLTLTDPRYTPLIPLYALQLAVAVPVILVARITMESGDVLILLLLFTGYFPISATPWLYMEILAALTILTFHILARLIGNYSIMSKLFPYETPLFKAHLAIIAVYVTEEEFRKFYNLGFPAHRLGKGILTSYPYPFVTYLAIACIFIFPIIAPY